MEKRDGYTIAKYSVHMSMVAQVTFIFDMNDHSRGSGYIKIVIGGVYIGSWPFRLHTSVCASIYTCATKDARLSGLFFYVTKATCLF